MKTKFILCIFFAAAIVLSASSCKKDYGNLNRPTLEQVLNNPSSDIINNLVTGTEAGMRLRIEFYLDEVGMIGREMYRFSGSEPRYTQDLLGGDSSVLDNNTFYITNPWASRYQVIKNANVLIQAATNSSRISDAQKKGYFGFAKTIKAYQLLLNLNMTYNNGIRVDVADPDNLGPVVGKDEALAAIADLLDEAANDLTGAEVIFVLSEGFSGFNNAAGFLQFNRALAARVAVYREEWNNALNYLDESFFALNTDFNKGVYHIFTTGSGDQLNPCFFPRDQSGEVRVAHPSYAANIQAGDDRINKTALRETGPISQSDLSSNRDMWVYTSSTAPMPIIRNEELILIYAEANIQLNNFGDAVNALNIIRNGHGLPDYSGAMNQAALINEMLYQRRYSLFDEGHRWIDMRRYNKLNELPTDRPLDNVWQEFPLPLTEAD